MPFSHILSKANFSQNDPLPRPVLPETIVWSYEPGKMVAAALSYLETAAATVRHLDAIAVDDGSVKQKTRRVSKTI
jgi:hypothetical protein